MQVRLCEIVSDVEHIDIEKIVNDYFATGDPDRNLVPIH